MIRANFVIEGQNYPIRLIHNLGSEKNCHAMINIDRCFIGVDSSATPQRMAESIFHEVMEALFPWAKVEDSGFDHYDFEIFVKRVWGTLHQNALTHPLVGMAEIVKQYQKGEHFDEFEPEAEAKRTDEVKEGSGQFSSSLGSEA